LPVVPQGFEPVWSVQLSGSLPSSATFEQFPWELEQLLQTPQLEVLQQVPSTQLPEPHSPPALQAAPSAFLPQVPPPHTPTAQSLSVEQRSRQVFPFGSHLNGLQDWLPLAGQNPLPLQKEAGESSAAPAGQEAARHRVLVPHWRQPPAPSQRPSLPQLLSAAGAQLAWGSAPPAGTFSQRPCDPGNAQLLQRSPQAELQQTPSTQKPEAHSGPLLHELPSLLVPQRPLLSHWLGGWHWLLSVQELKQSVPPPLQLKGAQDWVAPARQLPAPSQVDTSVRTPPAQEADRQMVPAA
jgi:hypothetical protein